MSKKCLISEDDLKAIFMQFKDYSISEETLKLIFNRLGKFLHERKMSVDELVNKVCEEIPEKFEIKLYMENGCGYVELFHCSSSICDDYSYSETIEGQILEALEEAKKHGK